MSEPIFDPMILPDEVKEMVNNALMSGSPMLLAAVTPDGKPLISYRGSVQVHSDDQLGLWMRNPEGAASAAIKNNPNVALMYRSSTTPLLEFQGRARIVTDPAERAKIYAAAPEREQQGDPEQKGQAVIIDLDLVQGVLRVTAEGRVFCRLARK